MSSFVHETSSSAEVQDLELRPVGVHVVQHGREPEHLSAVVRVSACWFDAQASQARCQQRDAEVDADALERQASYGVPVIAHEGDRMFVFIGIVVYAESKGRRFSYRVDVSQHRARLPADESCRAVFLAAWLQPRQHISYDGLRDAVEGAHCYSVDLMKSTVYAEFQGR